METKEYQPTPDFKKQFDELPFNGYMKLPMSMLSPVTIDDFKKAETDGPVDIFKKGDTFYIDDGNHRYFDKKRELFMKNDYQEPDLSKVLMEVKKIDPKKAINSWMIEY